MQSFQVTKYTSKTWFLMVVQGYIIQCILVYLIHSLLLQFQIASDCFCIDKVIFEVKAFSEAKVYILNINVQAWALDIEFLVQKCINTIQVFYIYFQIVFQSVCAYYSNQQVMSILISPYVLSFQLLLPLINCIYQIGRYTVASHFSEI